MVKKYLLMKITVSSKLILFFKHPVQRNEKQIFCESFKYYVDGP